jgi:dTDP-4-dehydrorhamnose reductase
MQILIIGAAGQLGKSLQEHFDLLQINYVALRKEDLDISNQPMLLRTLEFLRPRIVINVSGFTNVDLAESRKELSFQINAIGPENLAKCCDQMNIPFIHLSTDYVFDGLSNKPYMPKDLTNPKNIYGLSKVTGENAIQEFAKSYLILRTSWVYGEHGSNFLKTMLHLGSEKTEISIVSDQIGSPTYAGDLAKVIAKICFNQQDNKFLEGIYHYGGLEPCSWFTFAEEIFDAMQIIDPSFKIPNLKPILSENYKVAAPRPLFSALDSSKICNELGIEPSNWKANVPEAISKIITIRRET